MSKMNDLRTGFDADRTYTQHELTEMADEWLREDARSELCRDCGERGEEIGDPIEAPQEARDEAGNQLVIHWPKYECANGHMWYAGEGSVRGIGGDNPVLFEEHFQSRRRREIYNSLGSPDPSIVSGIYNRAHPQGRKINTPEARAKHGASYYRAFMLPITAPGIGIWTHQAHLVQLLHLLPKLWPF